MQTKLLVLDVDGTLTDGGCIWIPPATKPKNLP